VREVVKSAYELAIKECGNDVDSGEIWKEYIAFLAEREVRFAPSRHGDWIPTR
jgi:cleavage stimulation factor subunit 3